MIAAQRMGIEATVIVQTEHGPVGVDASLAPIVDALNKAGVPTIASCSGHGHRPGNIALRDGREIVIARNFEEARLIDGLFAFGANGEPVAPDGLSEVQRELGAAWKRGHTDAYKTLAFLMQKYGWQTVADALDRHRAASGIVAAEGGRDAQRLDERSEQSPTGEAGDAQ